MRSMSTPTPTLSSSPSSLPQQAGRKKFLTQGTSAHLSFFFSPAEWEQFLPLPPQCPRYEPEDRSSCLLRSLVPDRCPPEAPCPRIQLNNSKYEMWRPGLLYRAFWSYPRYWCCALTLGQVWNHFSDAVNLNIRAYTNFPTESIY